MARSLSVQARLSECRSQDRPPGLWEDPRETPSLGRSRLWKLSPRGVPMPHLSLPLRLDAGAKCRLVWIPVSFHLSNFQFRRFTHTHRPPAAQGAGPGRLPEHEALGEAAGLLQASLEQKQWAACPGSGQPVDSPGSWHVLAGRSEAQAAPSGDAQLGGEPSEGGEAWGPRSPRASNQQDPRAGSRGPKPSLTSHHATGTHRLLGNPGAATSPAQTS